MRAFAALAAILIGLAFLASGIGSESRLWMLGVGAVLAVIGVWLARPFRKK